MRPGLGASRPPGVVPESDTPQRPSTGAPINRCDSEQGCVPAGHRIFRCSGWCSKGIYRTGEGWHGLTFGALLGSIGSMMSTSTAYGPLPRRSTSSSTFSFCTTHIRTERMLNVVNAAKGVGLPYLTSERVHLLEPQHVCPQLGQPLVNHIR